VFSVNQRFWAFIVVFRALGNLEKTSRFVNRRRFEAKKGYFQATHIPSWCGMLFWQN